MSQKTQTPETTQYEYDVECPGCGKFSVEVGTFDVKQPVPLCIKRLCDVCGRLAAEGR